MLISDIVVQGLDSLVDAVKQANVCFPGQVWWRGQRCSQWELRPSVFRPQIGGGFEYEQSIIKRFQKRAPSRRIDLPLRSERHNWLFLMQHYRLPTRLLDWTESPLIAAYFATELGECKDAINQPVSNEGALYALSPYLLNLEQVGEYGLLMPDESPTAQKLIKRAFIARAEDQERVVAVRPTEVDTRLMVQLSEFTLHGSGLAIEQVPKSDRFAMKFRIPASKKKRLRRRLKFLGVRESTLFPDLEHLAVETAGIRFRPPPSHHGKEEEPEFEATFPTISPQGSEPSS